MDEYIFTEQKNMFNALDNYILNNKINKIFGGVTNLDLEIINENNKNNKEYNSSFDIHLLCEIEITKDFTIKEWKSIVNQIIIDELEVLLEIYSCKCKNKKSNVKLSQFINKLEYGNKIKFYISNN